MSMLDTLQKKCPLNQVKIFSNYPNLPSVFSEPFTKENIKRMINQIEDYFVYEFNDIIHNLKKDEKSIKIIECFQNLGGNPNKLGLSVFPINLLRRAHIARNVKLIEKL